VLRSFALTNLARDNGAMKWKIGIEQIKRNMGIIGGYDLGQVYMCVCMYVCIYVCMWVHVCV
jgi:hypothetical protein